MDFYEKYEKAETESRMKTCPICGKKFLPAPQHAWVIGYESLAEISTNFVCTYSCMRKWEKDSVVKKKEKKRQGPKRPILAINIETGEETKYDSLGSAARGTGVSVYFIRGVITGKFDDANGYTFKDCYNPDQQPIITSIPVIAINTKTGEETKFESMHSAARELGVGVGNVYQILRGTRQTAHGYTFKKCE